MELREYQSMFQVEKRHWWFRAKRSILSRLIRCYLNTPDSLWFDFGCGTGALLEALSGVGRGEGVDASPEAIRFCRQRGLQSVDLLTESWQPHERYDLIVSSDVLEHISDDKQALARLWRALKPGGVLIITVPAHQWLWSAHDVALHHQRRYSRRSLQALAAEVGLSWVYLSYYNFWLFLPAVLARCKQQLFPSGQTQADTNKVPPRWLNEMFFQIFRSEQYLLGKSSLPFGLSLLAIARKDA